MRRLVTVVVAVLALLAFVAMGRKSGGKAEDVSGKATKQTKAGAVSTKPAAQ